MALGPCRIRATRVRTSLILVIRTILLTAFALVAFAFNSILCRLALRGDEADAAGFTSVRLISGAITLIVISFFFSSVSGGRTGKGAPWTKGSWLSAFWLA